MSPCWNTSGCQHQDSSLPLRWQWMEHVPAAGPTPTISSSPPSFVTSPSSLQTSWSIQKADALPKFAVKQLQVKKGYVIHSLVIPESTTRALLRRKPMLTQGINVQPFYVLETLENKTRGLVVDESLATRPMYTRPSDLQNRWPKTQVSSPSARSIARLPRHRSALWFMGWDTKDGCCSSLDAVLSQQ